MITAPAMYHDVFTDAVAPHLRDGQIVLYNTGYWASLRTVAAARAASCRTSPWPSPTSCRTSASRAATPSTSAASSGTSASRPSPGSAAPRCTTSCAASTTQYDPAATVLDTNIAAAGNPPIHVTLTIPIAGFYFDRYMGGKFYQDATLPGVRLVDAFDAERERLAGHLGSDAFETEFDFDKRSYLYDGADIGEALRSSPHADWFATAAYLEQVCSEDIIYSFVPMVRLGEALGIDLPVTRAMIEVMGVMLQRDYWAEGLRARGPRARTASTSTGVRRFVMTGRALRESPTVVTLTGKDLTLDELVAVARHDEPVSSRRTALEAMTEASSLAEHVFERGLPTYGLTTGLGAQKRTSLRRDDDSFSRRQIEESHVGQGPDAPRDVGPRRHARARQPVRRRVDLRAACSSPSGSRRR